METSVSDSLMIMYEDESVDVRYGNGAQLQMSPCGCEFTMVKPKDPSGHPLQPTERIRQRTRFTISAYKEFMVAALEFRNKYASRPYLPEELIPADQKQPFVSIDSDVQWPKWSSCAAELGPGGKTIIRSEEGRAALMLSASGEEFSVEFRCSLSQTRIQRCSMQGFSRDSDSSPGNQHQQQLVRNLICQASNVEDKETKPEEMYQSTTVVQHHSCCAVDPTWCYPLSLARHLWTARLSKAKEIRTVETSNNTQEHESINITISITERRSHLPQALPLTCPSPHWHRWTVKDGLVEHPDQDLPTELLKVMWCQGVTYRILSGTVPVIEVSPGDGSVMRSNCVLNNYFTHHKPELRSGQVKEVTYHLNNLPPDVPGQLYSVCSIVSRASRILACYNEAKQSLKLPATPSCLQEGRRSSQPARMEEHLLNLVSFEQHLNVTQTLENRSDLVAAELEKIKRFNFLLENNHLITSDKGCGKLESSSPQDVNHEPVNEDCIADALQKTFKAIQDIDALISAATLT
ncbi:hypothetical protein PBY51_004088 [Eleginops maclovinus]|uniref:DUF4524 domain-containing protein n=1 Tax=Eleginops maclovinus TaxID=56733 RepID=A0AAN8AQB9_ELEMC|nr:hypothetical protein PBY51_004088 [Eleginops maclovinus]